jgi:hypothetical protein
MFGHIDVLVPVKQRRQVAGIEAAAVGDGRVLGQHGAESAEGVTMLVSDLGEFTQLLFDVALVQARRIASTSGKYLYKVVRPMAVFSAMCDIFAEVSPSSVRDLRPPARQLVLGPSVPIAFLLLAIVALVLRLVSADNLWDLGPHR